MIYNIITTENNLLRLIHSSKNNYLTVQQKRQKLNCLHYSVNTAILGNPSCERYASYT